MTARACAYCDGSGTVVPMGEPGHSCDDCGGTGLEPSGLLEAFEMLGQLAAMPSDPPGHGEGRMTPQSAHLRTVRQVSRTDGMVNWRHWQIGRLYLRNERRPHRTEGWFLGIEARLDSTGPMEVKIV